MAEPSDVQKVVEKLGATAVADGWTMTRIEEDLDLDMTPNQIALAYWQSKEAKTAHLVDVSESGSSRSLSNIHSNARAMVERYQRLVNLENTSDNIEDPPATRGPGIRTFPIRRVRS
jgi:hypothetical protein